jgi:tRNA threonylcarbamoyladenosine biosynthesis protein TsaE
MAPAHSDAAGSGPRFAVADEAATARLAAAIAVRARRGDVIALVGALGAGKTVFARAFIRARAAAAGTEVAEVPSPTFTLVQLYEIGGEAIWHADLYRIVNASEVEELGLDEAPSSGILLVEWPDRWGAGLPRDALVVHIAPGAARHDRTISLDAPGAWSGRLADLPASE